jgi:dihydroorotate dehydrogenase (fumarate)
VASASPLSSTLDGIHRLHDAGVGAIVMYSLFEEQLRQRALRRAELLDEPADSFSEALNYFPATAYDDPGPRDYLGLLERAAATTPIPVIASLNGVTPGAWGDYARQMQDAGAAAIELNMYGVPGDPRISGTQLEQCHTEVLQPQGRRHGSGRGQAQPVLQFTGRDGPAVGQSRSRRSGALQPLPATRHQCR